MKAVFFSITLSILSLPSIASDFGKYCYSQEHNLKENYTLRALFTQFDVGSCLEVESIIARTNRLDLSHAQLIDVKPFKHMKSVVHLDLSNNQIDDIAELSRAYQLETLDLSNNDIYDLSPLINLTALTRLNISNNPIEKNEYNCPTDSQNQALTFACFNVDNFESNFYEVKGQSMTVDQLNNALSQIFAKQRINFDKIVNLNAFSIRNMTSLQLTIQNQSFEISDDVESNSALKINVMQSGNLLKIEFYSPSADGTARFELTNNRFVLKNIEQ